jgi:hypothetical protein
MRCLKKDNNYEVILKFKNDQEIKYGIVITHDDVSNCVNDITLLYQHNINTIENLGILLTRYVDTGAIRDIRTGDGSIVMSDDKTFLYYKNVIDVDDDRIRVNFGTKRTPEYDDVVVKRSIPIIELSGDTGKLEIYSIKNDVELLYSSV